MHLKIAGHLQVGFASWTLKTFICVKGGTCVAEN
jgi:hypothetical protein